jgi:hypothetical protein
LFRAFGTETPSTARAQTALTATILGLLFIELDALIGQLRILGYSEQSYSPILQAFESRLTLPALMGQWAQNKPAFAACAPPLLVFAESLRSEEQAVSVAELSELSKQVAELIEALKTAELPDYVKQFVLEQIAIINRAIRDYPIAGAKAFKRAVEEGVFHDIEHAEEMANYEKSPEVSKLKDIQGRVVRAAKFTIEFGKFLAGCEIIAKAAGQLPEAVHYASGWIGLLTK